MNILRKQFLAHVGQTSPSPMLVEVARAEGTFFYTPEGKRYYDLVAGVSVSNVGHSNPAVVRAVQEQAARYMHVMVYGELVERPQVEYAARIAALLPGGWRASTSSTRAPRRSRGRSSWPSATRGARSSSPCAAPTTARPTGR